MSNLSNKRIANAAFSNSIDVTPTKIFSPGSNFNSQSSLHKCKKFNDPIHNHISFEGLALKIIDTPEFQRLHSLKQLGTCDYVFRGATHTRFEHSLGVAYLAESLVKRLQKNQPELTITDIDVICVQVAGLCHDLGHGPFSHVYDGVFIKKMFSDGIDGQGKSWRHETGSVMMFRHLLKKNNINLIEYGLSDKDQLFIEEIIDGIPER